ncbi:MAG: Gfo/Idh/MocA family oxidoreductase [Verrucomicrobia bacterium]|nr:Gfo/Idh/MocA family oxidoreductase [Verrucomicrobiota bacterium]
MTSRSTPVRLGLIGGGNVLGAYHPLISRLEQRGLLTVQGICAREHQRDSVRNLFGEVPFTTDATTLLAGDSELVVVLTSMPSHGPLVRAALEAGKHVLVEKPLATDWSEACALQDLARQRGRHLVAAPFTPLSPTFQILGARLARGDIGRPCLARARYGWSGPWWNEWFYQPGGGCLLDLGIYCFTTLTGLLGPARRVTALAGVAIPEREIQGRTIRVEAEDNAQVLVEFANGTLATVTTGFTLQQSRGPAVELYGTEGTLQMLGDDWDPQGYELWQNSAGCWQVFGETHPDWPWTDGLRDLVEALMSGRSPALPPEHALHVLELIERARQSVQEGRTLALQSSFHPLSFSAPQLEAAHRQHDRTREH